MDDEEDFIEETPPYQPSELAQMASSLVALSRAVDVSRDKHARSHLLTAMSGIAYMLNPPRGELILAADNGKR
jgi:hypothetical protein